MNDANHPPHPIDDATLFNRHANGVRSPRPAQPVGLAVNQFCVLALLLWSLSPAALLAQNGSDLGGADKTRTITFDDVKFEMKKGDPFKRSLLTDKIESLHGHPISIRGYILPSFQQKGITQFVLVRDNMECCFGPGAALYDCILVEMEPGKSTSFTVRPVAVEGIFTVNEFKGPDGKHLAIYHLKGQNVK
jgi:hypothetical protein